MPSARARTHARTVAALALGRCACSAASRATTTRPRPLAHAVLAPDVFAYDAYGLHHAADKPGREGHAVSLMGRQDARASIQALHAKFRDRNKLLAFAVDPQARVSGGAGARGLLCVLRRAPELRARALTLTVGARRACPALRSA